MSLWKIHFLHKYTFITNTCIKKNLLALNSFLGGKSHFRIVQAKNAATFIMAFSWLNVMWEKEKKIMTKGWKIIERKNTFEKKVEKKIKINFRYFENTLFFYRIYSVILKVFLFTSEIVFKYHIFRKLFFFRQYIILKKWDLTTKEKYMYVVQLIFNGMFSIFSTWNYFFSLTQSYFFIMLFNFYDLLCLSRDFLKDFF